MPGTILEQGWTVVYISRDFLDPGTVVSHVMVAWQPRDFHVVLTCRAAVHVQVCLLFVVHFTNATRDIYKHVAH